MRASASRLFDSEEKPGGVIMSVRDVTVEKKLEQARLAREDTLCRDSMPVTERRWLQARRSPLAQHWNLLTGLTSYQLSYAA